MRARHTSAYRERGFGLRNRYTVEPRNSADSNSGPETLTLIVADSAVIDRRTDGQDLTVRKKARTYSNQRGSWDSVVEMNRVGWDGPRRREKQSRAGRSKVEREQQQIQTE